MTLNLRETLKSPICFKMLKFKHWCFMLMFMAMFIFYAEATQPPVQYIINISTYIILHVLFSSQACSHSGSMLAFW